MGIMTENNQLELSIKEKDEEITTLNKKMESFKKTQESINEEMLENLTVSEANNRKMKETLS